MVSFLRERVSAAVILLLVRVYLGYSWLMAGYHKLVDGFDASGYLKNAVANPVKGPDGSLVYGWYVAFLDHFALANVDFINFIIPLGELLVGIGLILGCLTTAAMFFGLVMNFAFLLAGTVSHNPTDIFLGFIILVSGYNAGKFGFDDWVIPYLRKTVFKKKVKKTQ